MGAIHYSSYLVPEILGSDSDPSPTAWDSGFQKVA